MHCRFVVRFVAVFSALSNLAGCGQSADDAGESEDELRATRSNLLSVCPEVEGREFSSFLRSEPLFELKLSLALPEGRTVTTNGWATSIYRLRFLRVGRETRFELSIQSTEGAEGSIVGDQQLTGSGTVRFDRRSKSGELVLTERSDGWRNIVGDGSTIPMSNFGCARDALVTIELPTVRLEKASDETEHVIDLWGNPVPVSTSVRWTRGASAPLVLQVPFVPGRY